MLLHHLTLCFKIQGSSFFPAFGLNMERYSVFLKASLPIVNGTLTFYLSFIGEFINVTKKQQRDKGGVNLILVSLFYACSLCFKLPANDQESNVPDVTLNQTADSLSETLTRVTPLGKETFKELIFLDIFYKKIEITATQSTSGRVFFKISSAFATLV